MTKAIRYIKTLSKQDKLEKYFSQPWQSDGYEFKSPYMAALLDARRATNRNLEDGSLIAGMEHGSWIGALAYLILIEHIGIKFTRSDAASTEAPGFLKVLDLFSDLTEEKRGVLWALRCSFAHEYSLSNPKFDARFCHTFTVIADEREDSKFIALPRQQWRKGEPRSMKNTTVVNLVRLGDLVEGIHVTLCNLKEKSILELKKDAALEFIYYEKDSVL